LSFIGLDLSFTDTGISVIFADGKETLLTDVKTKPKDFDHDMQRCLYIADYIVNICQDNGVSMAAIESVFVGRNAKTTQKLLMLSTLVRYKLLENNIMYVDVSPTQLKKFLGVKGGGKNLIILEIFKKYGITITNDNIADSYILALICKAYYCHMESIYLEDSHKYQDEVIAKISSGDNLRISL